MMKKKTKKTRNKFEEALYDQLQHSYVNFKYESERLPYVTSHYYVPDFVVELGNGRRVYIEAKGYFRPEHKVKMRAVKNRWPDLDIRLVFSRYSDSNINWAERYGFPWAIGKIPEEWLNGTDTPSST